MRRSRPKPIVFSGDCSKEHPESPFAVDARFNLAESAHLGHNYTEVVRLLTPVAGGPPSRQPPRSETASEPDSEGSHRKPPGQPAG